MKIVKSLISISLAGFLLFSGSCAKQEAPKQVKIKLPDFKAIAIVIANKAEECAIAAKIKNQEEVLRVEKEAVRVKEEEKKKIEASTPLGTSGVEDEMAELERKKHEYIIDQLIKMRERERVVARIDVYYAQRGSPMQGTRAIFLREFERTGINPYLSVAISEGESTCGLACFAPHNAWGMLAYPGGFSSWDEGITANFNWLQKYFGCPQTAYDCPGYCEPSHPWMENVDGVREYIQNMDVEDMLGPNGRSGGSSKMLRHTTPNNKVVAAAYSQIGKPYGWGGTGPYNYDCSGLVLYCYNSAGVTIPRTADAQGACGTPIQLEQIAPGDVIGFHGWGHIGVYVGNGQYIHAPQTGDVVKVSSLSDRNDICGASKII